METVAFPPKFKQPNPQSFDGRGSPRQHIFHFKALTGGIAGNDALMIRLFVSTFRETAFDWYARLPAGTINSWADEDGRRSIQDREEGTELASNILYVSSISAT